MYLFKATYFDYVTDKEIEQTFEIDMCPFGPEDFKGESVEKVAWTWALGRAFGALSDELWFVGLELISY